MIATRTLTHPISLGAIALLVINDHVLKHVAPGVITGKLSDFAGLVFFPLLLAAAAEHTGIRRGVQTVIVAAIATAVVFAAIKVSVSAAEVYRIGLAMLQWPLHAMRAVLLGEPLPSVGRVAHVVDATDLVALVALCVPITLVHRAGMREGADALSRHATPVRARPARRARRLFAVVRR